MAAQQSHCLKQEALQEAFGRVGDMSTGKAKVYMENHFRQEAVSASAKQQRQKEYGTERTILG